MHSNIEFAFVELHFDLTKNFSWINWK